MTNSEHAVTITLFDRTYQIKCPMEEAAILQKSAKYLDEQMRKINQTSQSNNTERLAIVAALNVTHELMALKNQKNSYIDSMHDQIKSLQHRIQKFLGAKEEVRL